MELQDHVQPSRHLVKPGARCSLTAHDPAFGADLEFDKREARKALKVLRKRMAELQERLWAEQQRSILLVLQAMDTGGKDSTIRKVTAGLNPQGCRIYGFKAPSKNELARDFLWRVHNQVPPKGTIGIFNRSHYEDVLIVRVHGWASPELIDARYGHINAFEKLLHDHGTRVIKVMLHISKDYQKSRLQRRLENPEKYWKFNPDDLKERALWEKYMSAFEVAITKCSTEYAPWYVVPAETRWYRDLVVARLIVDALEEMDPQFPDPSFDPSEFDPDSII